MHYVVSRSGDAFICQVILPEKSPVRGLVGKPAARKFLSKKAAAFQVCVLLRERGLLDDHFISTYHKRLPAMRNARLAIKSKKTNQYDMKIKPAFWGRGRGTVPEILYPMILTLRPSEKLKGQYQPLIILTREPLPNLPTFPLYLEDDIECQLESIPMRSLQVSQNDLSLLTTFTLRIFQDLFNKFYEQDIAKMSYWIVPTKTQSYSVSQISEAMDPRQEIDWDALRIVQENQELSWSDKPASFIKNRFVIDKWDGKYRYFTLDIDPNLRPSDPPPPNVARRRNMDNIMSYSLSLFRKARARFLETCNWEQPVVRAELASLRRNLLDRKSQKERAVNTEYCICLEPLAISAVYFPLSFAFLEEFA